MAVGATDCDVVHLFDLDGLLNLHFETTDDWITPLANGQVVSTGTGFGNWLNLDGNSASGLEAAAFDSSLPGPNFPGSDPDLLVGTGNVLILQENPAQTLPGIYDVPDDHFAGGFFVLDFLHGLATPLSINLIDVEAISNQEVTLELFDRLGGSRTYFIPAGWTGDITVDGAPGYGVLDLTTTTPQPGLAATATAMESFGFLSEEVVRMRIQFNGSAAFDELRWTIDGSTTDRQDSRLGSTARPLLLEH